MVSDTKALACGPSTFSAVLFCMKDSVCQYMSCRCTFSLRSGGSFLPAQFSKYQFCRQYMDIANPRLRVFPVSKSDLAAGQFSPFDLPAIKRHFHHSRPLCKFVCIEIFWSFLFPFNSLGHDINRSILPQYSHSMRCEPLDQADVRQT